MARINTCLSYQMNLPFSSIDHATSIYAHSVKSIHSFGIQSHDTRSYLTRSALLFPENTASPDIAIVGAVSRVIFRLLAPYYIGETRLRSILLFEFVEGWENRDTIAPQSLPTLRESALIRVIIDRSDAIFYYGLALSCVNSSFSFIFQ